jgi:glutamine---fructose-6-phosphate transaminase (isomerizing)
MRGANFGFRAARLGDAISGFRLTDSAGAREVAVQSSTTIVVPQVPMTITPLVYAVPSQLIAHHTASIMGMDVDQPPNLAKSVTVE